MKTIRLLALLIAVSGVSLFPARALAQQEVAPDHFDQAEMNVSSAHAHSSKAVAQHHHSQASHVKMASKHGSRRAHHHSQRVSA